MDKDESEILRQHRQDRVKYLTQLARWLCCMILLAVWQIWAHYLYGEWSVFIVLLVFFISQLVVVLKK